MEAFRSATSWAAAIRAKEVSPVEVADLYLERMELLDPQLNAFTFRADGEVRAAARRAADVVASSTPEDLPPFHGVPLPIKDLNVVAGWPTSYGSKAASDDPGRAHELVVQRFVDAGFVLLGKTNTPELGTISFTENERFGATRNPWDPSRTPGGSSGGAGAAVASGMAPLAHASDGGGSIRIPASCNGLVGLKPSRNRVPADVNPLEGFATSGILTRTVADTAAVLDVIGVPDPLGWYNAPPPAAPFATLAGQQPPRLRVGLVTAPFLDLPVDAEVLAATHAAARLLESLGHEVSEMSLTVPDPDAFIGSFLHVWDTGSAGLPLDPDLLEPLNRELRAQAKAMDSVAYVEAVYTTQILARHIVAHFGRDVDVLLTPTMACLPPDVGSVWAGADVVASAPLMNCFPMAIFTSVWNVTGMPALSLPLGMSAAGLPIGVQFVAGPWQDALLLQLGTQIEAAAPWAQRRPQVC
jgi:amidase